VERIKNFINENRVAIFVFVCLLLFAGWLYKDHHRNDGINHDTDANLEQLEKRIDRIESRLDTLSERIDKAKDTAAEIGGRIESSTNLAKEVGAGIDGLQGRLDDAIQRSGRIANIIADIERQNK